MMLAHYRSRPFRRTRLLGTTALQPLQLYLAFGLASDLSGSSIVLSARALPYHPGWFLGCTRFLLPRGLQTSPSLAGWSPPLCVTRPNRVRFRWAHAFAVQGVHPSRTQVVYLVTGLLSAQGRPRHGSPRLHAEEAIGMSTSFQVERTVRLILSHQRSPRSQSTDGPEWTSCHLRSLSYKVHAERKPPRFSVPSVPSVVNLLSAVLHDASCDNRDPLAVAGPCGSTIDLATTFKLG